MIVKPAQDNILESWRTYNEVMSLKVPIERKIEILEQRLTKEEIDKVQAIMAQLHTEQSKLSLFEFLNQFPQEK